MLADYLPAFAAASKGQSQRVYLDAFAGEGAGLDRLTGEKLPGSARIALEIDGDVGFTKFRYFEIGHRAAELQSRLRAAYPRPPAARLPVERPCPRYRFTSSVPVVLTR